MRISLPPRPAAGGAKPASATVALPAAKPPLPGGAAPAPKGPVPASGPKPAAPMGGKAAVAAAGGVRTVVDTDSGGTALAVAALIASLISFGVVLMSFLQK